MEYKPNKKGFSVAVKKKEGCYEGLFPKLFMKSYCHQKSFENTYPQLMNGYHLEPSIVFLEFHLFVYLHCFLSFCVHFAD